MRAPVAHGIEIAEKQFLLQPALDRRDRARDLTGTNVSPRIGLS